MTICIVFKNGYMQKMKCESFSIEYNTTGDVIGYEAKGITENEMIFLNFNEILCVYRVMSDEVKE